MSVFLGLQQVFHNFFNNSSVSNEKKEIFNRNFFSFGSCNIPQREKAEKGGEDAFAVNPKLITIADGVGGWADLGIDSSLYSKELCCLIERLYQENKTNYNQNPKQLLIDAVSLNKEQGTSTSLIITFDDKLPIIYTTQIGDTSYMILRKVKEGSGTRLKKIYKSPEQCKSLNYPYQVGVNGDNPIIYATQNTHKVKNHDIIVCGSDGLFDNLSECRIVHTILPFLDHEEIRDISLLSEILAESAYEHSLDPNFDSPFSEKCRKFDGEGIGGKEDDITVVIGQVNLE